MSKIERLARAPGLRKLIVVVHFPCGFHFAAVLPVLKGLIIVPVETMGLFLLEYNPFKTVKRLVDYV